MTDSGTVLDAIGSMEGADLPHIHAPATVGEIVRQILERHPLLDEITHEDAEQVVRLTAGLDGAHYVPYRIGAKDGGNLAGPGTWASVGKGGAAMLQISGTLPIVFPQSDPAHDHTVLERAATELRSRIQAIGADPDDVNLLTVTRAAFGGEDVITFATPATPNGTDSFHVHLSHIPGPWSPGIEAALDAAARTIVTHHTHAGEIRRRIELIRDKVVQRFGGMGREVGDTTLLGVETDADGVASVKVATMVMTIGDAFEPRPAFLQMSEPVDIAKGEFDSFRTHSRNIRRRLQMLEGREAVDAYTMCPVVARDYARMDPARAAAKALDVRRAMAGRDGDPDDDTAKQGASFVDGRLTDTVRLGEEVTFRNRTLMARNIAPPESVMMNLPGRQLTDVVPDDRLEGLIVDKARIDSKGRLTVTIRPVPGVPLRAMLESMEGGR
jgi:hypothetical protein